MPKGSRNCEWMVTPPALSAAMPVGATITQRLCVPATTRRNRVVLPVPALPVRNTCRSVLFTNPAASAAISVSMWASGLRSKGTESWSTEGKYGC